MGEVEGGGEVDIEAGEGGGGGGKEAKVVAVVQVILATCHQVQVLGGWEVYAWVGWGEGGVERRWGGEKVGWREGGVEEGGVGGRWGGGW